MTRTDLKFAVAADLAALGADRWSWQYRWTWPLAHFLRQRRLAEYWHSQKGVRGKYGSFLAVRTMRLGMSIGCEVPLGVALPGFNLAHAPGVVIHKDARLGKNCRVHQSVTIGSGTGGVPRIGDDVVIGAGAVLLGGIEVGDGAVIGANSVVLASVSPQTTVAGAPARVIASRGSDGLVHDGYGIARRRGLGSDVPR